MRLEVKVSVVLARTFRDTAKDLCRWPAGLPRGVHLIPRVKAHYRVERPFAKTLQILVNTSGGISGHAAST